MPTETDLMGEGMSPFLAAQLGNTPNLVTCAATSSQTGATVILSKNSELSAADSSHNSAILQATSKIGSPFWFFTSSSTSAIVYVPVGHNLNGSANAGLTIAQNKGALLFQYKLKNWMSILTA